MSCFLCNSSYHVTQYCDNYIANKDRKEKIQLQSTSFTQFYSYNCYICCSRNHCTLFCPDRFIAPNFFVPNIDQNLFQRYLPLFDPYEKILLACQSPLSLNERFLLPLTIIKTIVYHRFSNLPKIQTNIVLCENLKICQNFRESDTYKEFYQSIVSKTYIILSKNITICDTSITSDFLSVLLSPRTKIFKIKGLFFRSKITLDEIFLYAPNLEEFEFKFHNPWQEENFFKNGYGKKFKKLKMTIRSYINPDKLIPFLNNDMSNVQIDVFVSLIITKQWGVATNGITNRKNTCRQEFLQKISNYFIPVRLCNRQRFSLYLGFHGCWNEKFKPLGTFALKN